MFFLSAAAEEGPSALGLSFNSCRIATCTVAALRPICAPLPGTNSGNYYIEWKKPVGCISASLWGVFHLRTNKTPEATTPVMPYHKQQFKAARKATAAKKNKRAHESEEPTADRGDLASAGSTKPGKAKAKAKAKAQAKRKPSKPKAKAKKPPYLLYHASILFTCA